MANACVAKQQQKAIGVRYPDSFSFAVIGFAVRILYHTFFPLSIFSKLIISVLILIIFIYKLTFAPVWFIIKLY